MDIVVYSDRLWTKLDSESTLDPDPDPVICTLGRQKKFVQKFTLTTYVANNVFFFFWKLKSSITGYSSNNFLDHFKKQV